MLQRYRAVIVVAITFVMLGGCVVAGAMYVRSKERWADAKLDEIEPRYARLKGLMLAENELRTASSAVQENVEKVVYPASLEVDRASSELQQRVKKLFESAGMTVVTSRILEPKPGKEFDLLSVSFSVNGGLSNLQTALSAIRREAPLLKVDDFVLQPQRRQLLSDPELVISTLTVSALRGRS